jgi:hypothetical protein
MCKENQGFKYPICNSIVIPKCGKYQLWKIAQGLQDEDLSTIKFEVIKRKYD